ncbi:hypothetical protein CPB85DRAFT_1251855 [Mucidula mucida]|nr:hypothetical protein CPB85DRAFT_1251855 [Mucidula mucida]
MERIKKIGKSILKRAGNKKRLRRSRSMPLKQFDLPYSNHNVEPLYSQPNARSSKPVQDVSGPSSLRQHQHQRYTDTEDYSFRASQLLPPLPMKILQRQEHERKIQYNRDLAAYQLEGRSPLMLNYRYMAIDHTHSTTQKPTPLRAEMIPSLRGESCSGTGSFLSIAGRSVPLLASRRRSRHSGISTHLVKHFHRRLPPGTSKLKDFCTYDVLGYNIRPAYETKFTHYKNRQPARVWPARAYLQTTGPSIMKS